MQKTFALKLESRYKKPLQDISLRYGYKWGEEGNITAFLRGLVDSKIRFDSQQLILSEQEQDALLEAIRFLCQRSHFSLASSLLRFLPAESLNGFQQAQLSFYLDFLNTSILEDLNGCIGDQRPFQLNYLDSTQKEYSFSVSYAEFRFFENRIYLLCWCEETQDNQDILGLNHNWCFRLDLVQEGGIIPLNSLWREQGLDSVEVEFLLFGRLAYAFQERLDDFSEWIDTNPPTRRVKRTINSSFWFVREILPYGCSCRVLSPPSIVDLITHEINEMHHQYSL